jgi:hypothetical protein
MLASCWLFGAELEASSITVKIGFTVLYSLPVQDCESSPIIMLECDGLAPDEASGNA